MADASHNIILEDCAKSCIEPELFSALENKTILITGGTGFIGKWLTEMVAYINHTKGYNIKLYLLARDIKKFKNEMPQLAEKTFISYIEQDIRNLHDLPADVNYIIHAAGSPDNRDHVSQPARTVETFYKGTQTVLDAASRLPELYKFVHISSHQIYGKNDSEILINEKFCGKVEPNGINNIYAEAKRITETLCAIYRNQFKLPILIIRPFAFIGPYHDLEKPWAINNFIRDGILGGPIRIIGNSSTVRSYLYASDMSYWLLKALIKGNVGENYNIGSNEAISLNDLALKVKHSLNNNIEILSKSSKETYANLSKIVADTSKIVKDLDVRETYTIGDAINRTIVWNQLNRK
ncbi:NAD-dependent epimerase/dehydratase family protein [Mucilaginibacter sp.]